MSNPSTPFGFTEAGLSDGISPNFGMYEGYISTSNTNSIYGGDVAAPISGGFYGLAPVVFGCEPTGNAWLPSCQGPGEENCATEHGLFWLAAIADVQDHGAIKWEF